jgi:hypothetical protein
LQLLEEEASQFTGEEAANLNLESLTMLNERFSDRFHGSPPPPRSLSGTRYWERLNLTVGKERDRTRICESVNSGESGSSQGLENKCAMGENDEDRKWMVCFRDLAREGGQQLLGLTNGQTV